jgi:ATP-dependent protease ClpP protease subunit
MEPVKTKASQNQPEQTFHTYLIGKIEEGTIRDVLKSIDTANAHPSITTIQLTLCSRGGDFYSAFALYDHIKASKKSVDILAEGACMSSALMVLQAARKRLARPHTVFALHLSNIRVDEFKEYHEFLELTEQYKRNQALFLRLTLERAGAKIDELERSLRGKRQHLTAQQAKEFGTNGLIDNIVQ